MSDRLDNLLDPLTEDYAEEKEQEIALLTAEVERLQAVVDAARAKCLANILNPMRSRDAAIARDILRALDGEP